MTVRACEAAQVAGHDDLSHQRGGDCRSKARLDLGGKHQTIDAAVEHTPNRAAICGFANDDDGQLREPGLGPSEPLAIVRAEVFVIGHDDIGHVIRGGQPLQG